MSKKKLVLFGVLILVVVLVVLNIGMAGNGHVEVVQENVSLTEENQKALQMPDFPVECPECKKAIQISLDLDQSNFFEWA